MTENFECKQKWKLEHICSKPHVLPPDLFTHSIFGKSMVSQYATKERIPCDLQIEHFRKLGFPDSFCTIIEYGLPLLLGANPVQKCVPNHASANMREHHEFISTTLKKWEQMGVIHYVSHQPHIVNPLSVVANERKKRLVLDARSSGLNDVIISPKFALPNLGNIVQTLYSNDFMLKLDLANGFLQLPIQKQEHTYLGFRSPIDSRFGVFTRLSFGLRSAPFLFSTFTHALKEAAKQLLNISAEVYIDD